MGLGNCIDNGQPKTDTAVPARSLAKRFKDEGQKLLRDAWTGVYNLNHHFLPLVKKLDQHSAPRGGEL